MLIRGMVGNLRTTSGPGGCIAANPKAVKAAVEPPEATHAWAGEGSERAEGRRLAAALELKKNLNAMTKALTGLTDARHALAVAAERLERAAR
jgi:hypothetical protein